VRITVPPGIIILSRPLGAELTAGEAVSILAGDELHQPQLPFLVVQPAGRTHWDGVTVNCARPFRNGKDWFRASVSFPDRTGRTRPDVARLKSMCGLLAADLAAEANYRYHRRLAGESG
jgi:hypothetical protein